MTVTVAGNQGIFRVVEADGSVCMAGRNPSDGGGFPAIGSAISLAETINARRGTVATVEVRPTVMTEAETLPLVTTSAVAVLERQPDPPKPPRMRAPRRDHV